MSKETKVRSVTKGIVWRILATLNGFLVALIFLQDIKESLKISIVANVTGFVLYYIHERIWNLIKWQRTK